MDTTDEIIDFDPTQYTDEAGDSGIYTFGEGDDQGDYQNIAPFEEWVQEGPLQWTPEDWDIRAQISDTFFIKHQPTAQTIYILSCQHTINTH